MLKSVFTSMRNSTHVNNIQVQVQYTTERRHLIFLNHSIVSNEFFHKMYLKLFKILGTIFCIAFFNLNLAQILLGKSI